MPELKNIRQERFCALVVQGIPPYRAYPMAGYRANDGSPYRLQGNARVQHRQNEIIEALGMKTHVTVETIAKQFNEDRDFAIAQKQPATAHAASVSLAKLHGLMVERKESGAPGEFAGLTSADEVLALIRAELGEEAAELLSKALERHDRLAIEHEPAT